MSHVVSYFSVYKMSMYDFINVLHFFTHLHIDFVQTSTEPSTTSTQCPCVYKNYNHLDKNKYKL